MRSPQRCWPHFFCCQNLHNSGSPVEKQTAVQWSGQKQFSEWTTVNFVQINTTFKSRFSYYMLLSRHKKSKPHGYTEWNWLCVLSKPCHHFLAATDLLQHRVHGESLQVLQVRVKEVGVRQGDLQQRLDDVADRAVIRQSDFLCRANEISQAKSIGQEDSTGLAYA